METNIKIDVIIAEFIVALVNVSLCSRHTQASHNSRKIRTHQRNKTVARLRRTNMCRTSALCIVIIFWLNYSALTKRQNMVRQAWSQPIGTEDWVVVAKPTGQGLNLDYPGITTDLNCPLCDSSVYTYCSNKLDHDACCCTFPGHQLHPYQCTIYKCFLLYAKSCYEHTLIKNCCCANPY